jgi:acyl carrier protein
MDTMERLDRIREIVADDLGEIVLSIDATSSLFELGLTSLSCIGILVEIESELGITVADDRLSLEAFQSLASLCTLIAEVEAEHARQADRSDTSLISR